MARGGGRGWPKLSRFIVLVSGKLLQAFELQAFDCSGLQQEGAGSSARADWVGERAQTAGRESV